MSNGISKEKELLRNPKVRARHLYRTDVLDRVGNLQLLPNTDIATTHMVADFYGVDYHAVCYILKRYREELEGNGARILSHKLIKELVTEEKFFDLTISPRGATTLTKVAILNVGFMLKNSEVASKVRSMVLGFESDDNDTQVKVEEEVKPVVRAKEVKPVSQTQPVPVASYMIDNPIERAKQWIVEQEEKMKLEETVQEQNKVIEQKNKIISDLTEDISDASKRRILVDMVRNGAFGSKVIASRWSRLYGKFEALYNKDVIMATEEHNRIYVRNISTLDYIDKELGMINELFDLGMRMFSKEATDKEAENRELMTV